MKSNGLILAFVLLFAFVLNSQAQDTTAKKIPPERKELIVKFLEVSGSTAISRQIVNDIVNNFKAQLTVVPAKFWEDAAVQADTNSYTDMLVTIYDAYFTDDDLEDLIDFYETKVGKKYVGVSGKIFEQSYSVSEKWGTEFTKSLMEKLNKAGYLQNEEQNSSQPQENIK